MKEFEALLEIAKDTSLNRYPNRLYDRTAFTFRNAKPSVYYNLMQINLVLTDYDNAWKFAELFYDATIKPNPASINAPYFNAEMAIAKAYQEDFAAAKGYLDKSRAQFNMPEDSIPYISYFIAAGMLAENARQNERALHYYASALQKGNTQSQHMIPPEIYYARMLIKTGNINEAEKVLSKFQTIKETRKYSAIGLNYYHDYAELLSRKNDNNGYVQALKTYYSIKDSLTNLNRYRAIQQMQATVLLQNREQQIAYLHHESAERTKQARRERLFYILLIALAGAIILLLVMYLRNRQIRSRQQQALQQNKLDQMEKQRDIELMQSMMQAEENERHKIADQLHNEVNAMLALAQLNVSSAIENSGDEQATKKLSKAHEAISTVSSTIRDLSHRLTPLIIEKFGFRKAIEDMAEAINISEKIKVETVIVGFEDQARHPVPLQNDIYRIIQELLHNILKHSVATSATIQVVEHENNISIIVEDNGIGIDEGNKLKGKGLDAIRSKVTFLKGHVEISRKKEGGTLVVMEIAT